LEIIDAANLDPITVPIGARCIVASIYWRSAGIPIRNSSAVFLNLYGDNNSLRFAYSSGHYLPTGIGFALLGWKRKYIKMIKSKTTAKLRGKRTSIAAVRDIL
jgi:hypothetical protein